MGSYNATCFASRQTIVEGEPCLIFPIAQNATYSPVSVLADGVAHELLGVSSSTVSPEAFWEFCGPVVSGRSKEAALVDLDDTPRNRRAVFLNLRDLMRTSVTTLEGSNRSHDVPFDSRTYVADHAFTLVDALQADYRRVAPVAVDFDDEALWADMKKMWRYVECAVRQHRVFVRHSGHLRPLQFASMHKVAFDALVASVAGQKDWNGQSYETRPYFDRLVAEAQAAVDESWPKDEGGDSQQRNHDRRFAFAGSCFPDVFKRMGCGSGRSMPQEHGLLFEAARRFNDGEITQDRFFELMLPSLELRYALRGMTNMNIKFAPMEYAGDERNHLGRAFNQFVGETSAAISKRIEVRYDDVYGDVDDDDTDQPRGPG